MSPRALASVLVVVAAAVSSAPARAASPDGGQCYADWSDAAPIVAEEQLIPARGVHELARGRVTGDLIRITLCREESRFVYRLLIRDGAGRVSHVVVDARKPFAPW